MLIFQTRDSREEKDTPNTQMLFGFSSFLLNLIIINDQSLKKMKIWMKLLQKKH